MGVVHSRIDLSLRCLGAIDLCVCNLSTFFCFLQALCPLDTSAEQTVPVRMVVAISPQAWRGRLERHREDLVGPAVPGAASTSSTPPTATAAQQQCSSSAGS